ncbi:MAG: sensor histidine kinase [Pirellulaceae bacterium]
METLRVLVTDDEPGMRLGVRRVLRGFRVDIPDIDASAMLDIEEADSGEVALARIRERVPDILILDDKMSGISGLDVLDQVGDRHGEMLTIMITAYASIETAVRAVKRGAYDFLAKPFTPDELRNTIKKAAVRLVLARQARRLAEERNEVRLQFMRTLSHELQAPLAAVEGFLELIRNRTEGEHVAAYDDMVARGQHRITGMRRLIQDLLQMTTVESRLRTRQLELVDLQDIARTAIDTFAQDVREHGLRLTLHGDASITLHGESSELSMVLQNLISNAVKYNRPGGQIHVTLDRNEDTISIGVADTGWGIPAPDVDRLCQEFVRIKNDHTRDVPGTGLGLSIVKKVARLYGGDVLIDSEPGVGSKFTVVLHDSRGKADAGRESPTCRTDLSARLV